MADANSKTEHKPPPLGRFWGAWSRAVNGEDAGGAVIDWFVWCFLVVGGVALVLCAISAMFDCADGIGPNGLQMHAYQHLKEAAQSCSSASGLRILALGLIMAGACTCTGWLLGLLFGVPRAVAVATDENRAVTAKTAAGGNRTTASKVNTNLEDISDWLTKTLVGASLIELGNLPKFLGDVAFDANAYGFGWGDHGQLLALAIILYFVPGGFWLGYMATRTVVTRLLNYFDSGAWSDHVDRAKAVDSLEIDGLNKIRPAQGEVVMADAAVLSRPLQDLKSIDELIAWAAAQARAQNLEAARVVLENVLGSDPGNEVAIRQLVKVYIAGGHFDLGRTLAQKLPDSPPKMLAALYDPPPGGYAAAQAIGEVLIKDPKADASPSIHIWLACAYGQDYSNKLAPKDGSPALKPDDPKMTALKDRVRLEISKAIVLDGAARDVLRDLWRPEKGAIDNDLSAFSDDDLKDILGDPPAP